MSLPIGTLLLVASVLTSGTSSEMAESLKGSCTIPNESDAYKQLKIHGLDDKVAEKLAEIYRTGKLAPEDLDDRALDALKTFPVDCAINVLIQFAESNLQHVSNKSAYLCGFFKSYRQKSSIWADSGSCNIIKGPDEHKIKEILSRTGYSFVVTSQQRIYGGPPPGWAGPAPKPSCEVFCGKLPRDVYEDELIPLFEQCGVIWDLRLLMDAKSANNRGYAFVTFTTEEAARLAKKKLDNHEIRPGRHLKLGVNSATYHSTGKSKKSKDKDDTVKEVSNDTDIESKTPVSALNEICQKLGFPLPIYYQTNISSEGHPHFLFSVSACGMKAHAEGNSKAKHQAASNLIEVLRKEEWTKVEHVQNILESVTLEEENFVNEVGLLQNHLQSKHLPLPVYNIYSVSGSSHSRIYTISCRVGKFEQYGYGESKKNAKHDAARKMRLELERSSESAGNDSDLSAVVPGNKCDDMKSLYLEMASNNFMLNKPTKKEWKHVEGEEDDVPVVKLTPFLRDLKEGRDHVTDLPPKEIFSQILRELECHCEVRSLSSSEKGGVSLLSIINTNPKIHIIAHGADHAKAHESLYKKFITYILSIVRP